MGHRCTGPRPLRWVTTTDIACRLPWTGSWTDASYSPSAVGVVSAMIRVICAASAHDARGRTSHNPPVVGSSPTRPDQQFYTMSVGVPWRLSRNVIDSARRALSLRGMVIWRCT
jgi:hypothetical protein